MMCYEGSWGRNMAEESGNRRAEARRWNEAKGPAGSRIGLGKSGAEAHGEHGKLGQGGERQGGNNSSQMSSIVVLCKTAPDLPHSL